jgi:FlaA1/EpsC-like NDP-sugar epimerase
VSRVFGGSLIGLRRLTQAGWDATGWLLACAAAIELRYEFNANLDQLYQGLLVGIIFAALQLLLGYFFYLYRGRYRIGSVDEIVGLVIAVTAIALFGTAVIAALQPAGVPRSLPVLAGVIVLVWMLAGRLTLRVYRERIRASHPGARTLIYGAGQAGDQILRLMSSDDKHVFHPVGFLDDDANKKQLRMMGIRVLGTGSDLERIVIDNQIEAVVVAFLGVSASELRNLTERCSRLEVDLRVVPTASALMAGSVRLQDLSAVTLEDLLGRQPISTDENVIAAFLTGRKVLITGAGGSIGSELARQVSRYQPSRLVLLDRDESALQAVELALDGQGLLDPDLLVLADIRDVDSLYEIFKIKQPEIVFHAAALKHLSLLEAYPQEAYKTNVLGTMNVLEAALAATVETFVNISTDKAANPSCVLGTSKLVTERLAAGASSLSDGRYLSVRFGNVLGSRGSVINTFRSQIDSGGPVTLTDPEVTRFFMTVQEAVHLVLQAAAQGAGGKTLILDMGEPVKISSVAQQLIEASGKDIEIRLVGLRPGEKLHEELVGDNETLMPTQHPRISMVEIDPLPFAAVREQSPRLSPNIDTAKTLERLAGL